MMRFLLSALLIFVNFSFISGKKEKQFFQDVVRIHGAQHGLPDGTVRKVEFLGKHPVVVLQDKSYGWNGEKWKLFIYCHTIWRFITISLRIKSILP